MSNTRPRSQERPPNFLGGHGGETAFYGKLGSIIQPNPSKLGSIYSLYSSGINQLALDKAAC